MDTLGSAPAPTSYNVTGTFGHDHQDFNRAKYSSMFQKPIAEPPTSPKLSHPAPNQYDVNVFSLPLTFTLFSFS